MALRNRQPTDTGSLSDRSDRASVQSDQGRVSVNDPDTTPLHKAAPNDIRHFFRHSGDKVVCIVCRQVFYMFSSSVF